MSGCAGTVVARRGRRRRASRAAGARSRRASACGTSAPSSFARTSAVAWPTWASGASQRSMSATRSSASRFSARSAPTKSSTKPSAGAISSSAGVAYWARCPPSLQDRDPVAHLDRLVDVVGDEEDRLAQLGLQAQELVLQALAVDRVDGAERLVHQHHARVGGQRPGDADPLLLAAGELRGVAVAELGVEADQLEQLGDARRRRARGPSRAGAGRWRCSAAIVRCGKRPICWIT